MDRSSNPLFFISILQVNAKIETFCTSETEASLYISKNRQVILDDKAITEINIALPSVCILLYPMAWYLASVDIS